MSPNELAPRNDAMDKQDDGFVLGGKIGGVKGKKRIAPENLSVKTLSQMNQEELAKVNERAKTNLRHNPEPNQTQKLKNPKGFEQDDIHTPMGALPLYKIDQFDWSKVPESMPNKPKLAPKRITMTEYIEATNHPMTAIWNMDSLRQIVEENEKKTKGDSGLVWATLNDGRNEKMDWDALQRKYESLEDDYIVMWEDDNDDGDEIEDNDMGDEKIIVASQMEKRKRAVERMEQCKRQKIESDSKMEQLRKQLREEEQWNLIVAGSYEEAKRQLENV